VARLGNGEVVARDLDENRPRLGLEGRIVAGPDALGEHSGGIGDVGAEEVGEQLAFAALVVRSEPDLPPDEMGQVAGDADLVLEVRRDGVEDLLVEQAADRGQEVRGLRWELHGPER
jgi:hypothetical protein